jgi:hypothetical protein
MLKMPSCGDGSKCTIPDLPLDNGHHCPFFEMELRGVCGVFYNEDSIRFQHLCSSCDTDLCQTNHIHHVAGKTLLEHPLTYEKLREMSLLPSHIQLQHQQETDPSMTHIPVFVKKRIYFKLNMKFLARLAKKSE